MKVSWNVKKTITLENQMHLISRSTKYISIKLYEKNNKHNNPTLLYNLFQKH